QTTFAEVDAVITGKHGVVPNDTFFGNLWGINQASDFDMNGPEAWDWERGRSTVITVILDIGVQLNHPDLNVYGGNDLTGNGTGGYPGNSCDNHGTAVASCVSGRFNNATGVVG